MGFYEGNDFLRYIAEHDKSKTRWDNLENGAFVFWYRGSPVPMPALRSFIFSDAPGSEAVWTNDPPLEVSGETLVTLTPRGHLTQLIEVPPQIEKTEIGVQPIPPKDEKAADTSSLPEWAPLFSAAGLDQSKWTPTQPMWTPPVDSDSRAAWTGSLAERPNIPMRIEAAAYQGKPVYFELIGPWTHAEREQPYHAPTEQLFLVIFIVLFLAVWVGCAMLARRNLRLGRGDRRGASRLAAFVFVAWAVTWFFGAHHVPNFAEFPLFIEFLVWGLAWGCFMWLLYVALEPYVRRRWPATLISWSRLLAGGFRDPVVGRDVLVGCLFGAFVAAMGSLMWFFPSWLGYLPAKPLSGPVSQFLGARAIIPYISFLLLGVPFLQLSSLFVLFLFRALLRKQLAAAIAWVLLFTVFYAGANQFSPSSLVWSLIVNVVAVFLLIRFGLLALVATWVFFDVLTSSPLTTQWSAWYAGISLTGILLMITMAFYAFYTSLGGRPVFGSAVLEE